MHRFSDSFVCSEVDDSAEFMTLENATQRVDVACVAFFERNLASDDFFDAFQCGGFGIGEIVDDNDVVACFDERYCSVGAYISGSAGNKNSVFILTHGLLNLKDDKSCRGVKIES